ncbi:MAG: vWA domain-containing protein [Gammaproteobacteria bacterium]
MAEWDLTFLFGAWVAPLMGEPGNLVLSWPIALLALPLPWLVRRFVRARSTGSDSAALGVRVPGLPDSLYASRPGRALTNAFPWLSLVAWVVLLFAVARPQWVGTPQPLPAQGRDLMLAVDISGSMEEADYVLGNQRVTRLDAVKAVAARFIEQRVGDRLGLILFGGQAYLQTPLTHDRQTVANMLLEAEVGLAGKATAIGDAIGLSLKRLKDLDSDSRVLILLTDGENTAGAVSPREAAELAADNGIRIYTIGLGGGARGPFGIFPGTSGLDETLLNKIAEETGGRYFRANDTGGLLQVYEALDRLEPREDEQLVFRPVTELYHWPLGLAVLIWLAGVGLARVHLPGIAPLRPGGADHG